MEDHNNETPSAQTHRNGTNTRASLKPVGQLLSGGFAILWSSALGLISLVWEVATQGLKMLLDTLKEIPPIVIGLVSATLLCWFGLTILTSNETIRIIFAVTLSLLAIGAMGLAYLQKWMEYKKNLRKAEWEQMNAVSTLQEKLLAFEKLSDLLKKIPVENPENAALLEAATTKSLLTMLEQIGAPIAPTDNPEADHGLPALQLPSRLSGKRKT